MENLISYKSILFGFTNYGGDCRIIAFKNGESKTSRSNTYFLTGDVIRNFITFKGDLYALVASTSRAGQLIKLSEINSGAEDTWDNMSGSGIDEAPKCAVLTSDYIYVFGSSTLWKYNNGVISDIATLPTNLDVYYALYFGNDIFMYGVLSGAQKLYKFNGTTFTELDTSASTIAYSTYYNVYGKKLLVEYRGCLYYVFSDGANINLKKYDMNSGRISSEMVIGTTDFVVTSMMLYEGLILMAYYDIVNNVSNVKIYVPIQLEVENSLVIGDGDISDSIKVVKSDPIFSERSDSNGNVPCFNTYPIVGTLKGKINNAFKYGNRKEMYSDIIDAKNLVDKNLKDLVDNINTMIGYVTFVDGENIDNFKPRDIIGQGDRLLTIKDGTDYGDNFIKSIDNVKMYPNNFRRITINWANIKWGDNYPVSVGSIESVGNVFDYDSILINDPITAQNIALHLLKQLVTIEQVGGVLSFSHFLELYDNISFDVNTDIAYFDKNVEYKMYSIEHNLKEKTSTIVVVERVLTEEIEEI